MDRSLLEKELECAKYGRPKQEIIDELQGIDEAIFSMGGPGKINIAYDVIVQDPGLLTFLDDIAKQRLISEGSFYLPNTEYHKKERVKELLSESRKLPYEIYQ